jgi:uroporphyrinogen decarboxylase
MNKRERLERTIAGEQADRPPVALWRHFPGDDLRAADLAQAVIDDQRSHDWDIVNIMPGSAYQVLDYGILDQWHGNPDGERIITKRPIERSLGWTELRALDPSKGWYARQADCVHIVSEALPDETPLLLTLYSPLAQAEMLAGRTQLILHLRTHGDRLKSGLNVLTENVIRYLDTLRKLPLAGICLVIRHADHEVLSDDEYRAFGLAYDLKILQAMPSKWWLRAVRLEGSAPMLRLVSSLPTHVLQWRDRDSDADLALGKAHAPGAVCGGLSAERDVFLGTPIQVRDSARDSLLKVNARRTILSTGSPLLLTSPYSNVRAARAAADSVHV